MLKLGTYDELNQEIPKCDAKDEDSDGRYDEDDSAVISHPCFL